MPGRAVLASCAAAALLAAPAAAAEGGLSLRAEPDRLVLGPDMRAAIEIEGSGDVPPTVTVNVGRVERLRPVARGRFVAEYVPPAERHPQVAIVAASSGDAWGWTAIPLVGRGLAIARSAPHARIHVTIGGASFGPVTADASGEARVPVVVPPGARFAYQRNKPLDLKIPPALHVHLALGRSEAPADAAHEIPLRAFVVSPSGTPRAGAPLRIEVSEGRVVALVETKAGSWEGKWQLEPGPAGAAKASATVADEPGLTAVVRLSRSAGRLAHLSAGPAAQRVVAAGETVPLRIAATDAAGNLTEAAAPMVEASLGQVSKLIPVAAGTWETRLTVPSQIGTARRLEIVARADGAEARTELAIAAGPPAHLDVHAESTALVADGGSAARVRVLYRDGFGNPADGPAPEVTTTRPAEIAAEPDGPGAWVVRYRPPRAWKNREDVLSLRAGGLEGSARLGIVAPERRLGVAGKAGLATASGGVHAPYGALEATYRFAWLPRELRFGLELGWFDRDRTDVAQVGDAAVAVRGRARYLPALCTARWEFGLGARQALWAGAGAGVAHVRSEVSTDGGPLALEQGVVPEVHAGAGWTLRRGHGWPFVEARVARHGDPQFEALRGSLTALLIAVGYRYDAY